MADAISGAAEEIRRQLDEKVAAVKADPAMAEILRLHNALTTLQALSAQEPTSLSAIFGLDSDTSVRVRPGEFYALTPLDGAKKYLKKWGEARPLDDILQGLQAGGCKADKDDLRLKLARSTYEVAKVGDDLYGLVEFYPHLKRGKKKRSAAEADTATTPDNASEETEETDEPTDAQS